MEKIIIINQKAYLNTVEEVQNFIEKTKKYKDKIIVLPSDIYIKIFKENGYIVGSQNISDSSFGAHTGETTATSVKDMGGKYALIGHSEIREKYQDDKRIISKIQRAKENKLKIILCVGEKNSSPLETIDRQLENISPEEDIYISYEPVWAIDSNNTPTKEEVEKIVKHIKEKGFKKVLYGGSVNEESIKYLNIPSIDGFLIGGCTLKPNSIEKMIEVISK